jgi:Ca2+-binding EF-hand superfamily protein
MLNTDTAENVTDEFLQAILEKFDLNSTGDIDFEEFRRMVHPILS